MSVGSVCTNMCVLCESNYTWWRACDCWSCKHRCVFCLRCHLQGSNKLVKGCGVCTGVVLLFELLKGQLLAWMQVSVF